MFVPNNSTYAISGLLSVKCDYYSCFYVGVWCFVYFCIDVICNVSCYHGPCLSAAWKYRSLWSLSAKKEPL